MGINGERLRVQAWRLSGAPTSGCVDRGLRLPSADPSRGAICCCPWRLLATEGPGGPGLVALSWGEERMAGRDMCRLSTYCSAFGKQAAKASPPVGTCQTAPCWCRGDQVGSSCREPVFRPLTSGRCAATPSGVVGGTGGSVRVGVFHDLRNAPGDDVVTAFPQLRKLKLRELKSLA